MSRILIAVLNWGMGHASRSLPLIEGAIDLGWDIDIASSGDAMVWLKSRLKNNEQVTFFEKPGANIRYSRHFTMLAIASQTPKLLKSIYEERQWTRDHLQKRTISKIFSDNCYGVHHPDIPSLLMTHLLKFPVSNALSPFAQIIIKKLVAQFDGIWVPDNPKGSNSIAGCLTSKSIHPNTTFIGLLSRLKPVKLTADAPLVGLVSGPEPHRTIMENALRKWMELQGERGLILAGKPGGGKSEKNNITTLYDPSDEEISKAICGSKTLICRSGYTTLLDLASLGKRAILIPTPGQREQELLSKLWAKEFGFAHCTQKDLENMRIPEISGIAPKSKGNKIAINELAAWLKN